MSVENSTVSSEVEQINLNNFWYRFLGGSRLDGRVEDDNFFKAETRRLESLLGGMKETDENFLRTVNNLEEARKNLTIWEACAKEHSDLFKDLTKFSQEQLAIRPHIRELVRQKKVTEAEAVNNQMDQARAEHYPKYLQAYNFLKEAGIDPYFLTQ